MNHSLDSFQIAPLFAAMLAAVMIVGAPRPFENLLARIIERQRRATLRQEEMQRHLLRRLAMRDSLES